ncbi:MAG: hypothetical protein KDB14_23110 [Planctomycetales bacterium]|nr:hypothetical protein [Planctomycetales bacterium]
MERLIGSAFAGVLEAGRDRYNALFAQARRNSPRLDADEFVDFLRRRVDPIVDIAANACPDATTVAAVVDACFLIGIELLQRGFAGRQSRFPEFEPHWSELLMAVARRHGAELPALVGPLSNAAYNLTVTSRCRIGQWVKRVGAAAEHCADAAELRAAGQVCAWICGMAHYRAPALELARAMPAAVLASLLQLEANDERLAGVVDRLASRRWYRPDAEPAQAGLAIVAEAGGFRGLGGEFLRPPLVEVDGADFLVRDGDAHWLLTADAFGATFHRVARPSSPSPDAGHKSRGAYAVNRAGVVSGPDGRCKFACLASSQSSAATDDTLAVTLPHSHRVFLVGEALA